MAEKTNPIVTFLRTEANHLDQAGLLRHEQALRAVAGPTVTLGDKELINLATPDYLGLSTHVDLKRAAKAAIDSFGVGPTSSRAVAGTLALHGELEQAVTRFLRTEDTVVFPSGYHANTGLLESLFTERDFVFCDEQIHPSLADGIRLCRARVFAYRNNNMVHLEDLLKRSRAARFRVIVTDGVFPLDGTAANLQGIRELADRYEAVLAVDDSQGIGVLGATGRGSHEAAGLPTRIDIVTGSFGYAFGVGAGGFVSGRKEIIAWLRQKSRPYLASAAMPASSAAAALKAVEIVSNNPSLRDELRKNVNLMRSGLAEQGLQTMLGAHPAIAVLVGDAVATQRMADILYRKGVYAMGFCHPVVPEGEARLRAQVSCAHPQKSLRTAIDAFADAARLLGLRTRKAAAVKA